MVVLSSDVRVFVSVVIVTLPVPVRDPFPARRKAGSLQSVRRYPVVPLAWFYHVLRHSDRHGRSGDGLRNALKRMGVESEWRGRERSRKETARRRPENREAQFNGQGLMEVALEGGLSKNRDDTPPTRSHRARVNT